MNPRFSRIAVPVLATASLLLADMASAELIRNGGFDECTVTPGGSCSTAPWTSTANLGFRTQANVAGSAVGFIEFADERIGTVSQVFDLATASVVDYEFFLGRGEAFGGQNDVPLTFVVRIDSSVLSTDLPAFSTATPFSLPLATHLRGSISLPAGMHTLAFDVGRGPTSFGRAPFIELDGIRLAARPVTSVPEPGMGALLLAALGMRLRRRAR